MAKKYKSKHTGQKIDKAVDSTDNKVVVFEADTMIDGQGIERSLNSKKKIISIIGANGIKTYSNNTGGTNDKSAIVIDASEILNAGSKSKDIRVAEYESTTIAGIIICDAQGYIGWKEGNQSSGSGVTIDETNHALKIN